MTTRWTGNSGSGTSSYRAYSRNHELSADGKATAIAGSSDPLFRGDGARYSPEELLVASLSACHMLWVLHLCAEAGITVTDYTDDATGTMIEDEDGGGRFTSVVLRPVLTIEDEGDRGLDEVHRRAHELCFIARSMAFPVTVEPGTST
jgi:organic hydroperoxide reductase OsmC/OhrA